MRGWMRIAVCLLFLIGGMCLLANMDSTVAAPAQVADVPVVAAIAIEPASCQNGTCPIVQQQTISTSKEVARRTPVRSVCQRVAARRPVRSILGRLLWRRARR